MQQPSEPTQDFESFFNCGEGIDSSFHAGPQGKGSQESKLKLSKEEEALFDDDDLEDDELDELEAKLESTHVK